MITAFLALILAAATPAQAQVPAAQRQSLFGQLHGQQRLLDQEHQQLDEQRAQQQMDQQCLRQQFQIDRLQQQIETQRLQQLGPAAAVR